MAEKKYVYIDVVDTALLCGLDIKPGTLGNNEVQARCPYCGDYKYRMYLSRQPEKSTFWCHNCGTGGNAVTLYADFNPGGRRLTTKEAYLELLDHPQVHTGESPYEHDRYIPEPIRPLHERSQIYLELLSLLTLEEKHRQKSAAPRALGRDHSREHVPQYSDKLETAQAGRRTACLAL